MKVFISWSGQASKQIAEIFRTWIPAVIQAVKPYYSPNDIEKGTRWSVEIAKELESSRFGIICLTKENLDAPWIMFEAGALSKNLDRAKVCPFLFGVEPADVQGPLVQFQAARFEKSEVKKLMKAINTELGDNALAVDVLEAVFEMWWPKLEEQVSAALAKVGSTKGKTGATRSEKEMLEEILGLTRNLSRTPPAHVSPRAVLDLIQALHKIVDQIIGKKELWVYSPLLDGFEKPLVYLASRTGDSTIEREAIAEFERIKKALQEEDVPF